MCSCSNFHQSLFMRYAGGDTNSAVMKTRTITSGSSSSDKQHSKQEVNHHMCLFRVLM